MNFENELFRGKDYKLNDSIIIKQPTLGEIFDYGEKEYYSMLSQFLAVPSDCKFQLFDMGIDYEEIDDFDFFVVTSGGFQDSKVDILIDGVDFTNLGVFRDESNGNILLKDNSSDAVIDRAIFSIITEYLRSMHFFKKNTEVAGNEATKAFLIEEQREAYKESCNKEYESMLIPLITALTNCSDFKYNYHTVWDLPIYVFMKSVMRVQKAINYSNLMTGIYSGNIDMSKIKKSELQWL